ncbi:MAG: CvpA family protein [Clostridia bacterium]|nr:CvpA family protein [Clostridia bacterium]
MPTTFEIIIIAVFALLLVLGFVKGFMRILLALLEFFAYIVVWVLFMGKLGLALETRIFPIFTQTMIEDMSALPVVNPSTVVTLLWMFIAFWVLFLVVRLLFALIGAPIKRAIRKGRPIRRWDRAFGVVFLTIILIAITSVLMAVFQNIGAISDGTIASIYPELNGAVGRMLKPTIDKLPTLLNDQVMNGLFLKLVAGDKNLLGNLVIGFILP